MERKKQVYTLQGLNLLGNAVLVQTSGGDYVFKSGRMVKKCKQCEGQRIPEFFNTLITLLSSAEFEEFFVETTQDGHYTVGNFWFGDLRVSIVRRFYYHIIFESGDKKFFELYISEKWKQSGLVYVVEISRTRFKAVAELSGQEATAIERFRRFYSEKAYNYFTASQNRSRVVLKTDADTGDIVFMLGDNRKKTEIEIDKNGIYAIASSEIGMYNDEPHSWLELKNLFSLVLEWGWEIKQNGWRIEFVKLVDNNRIDTIAIEGRGDEPYKPQIYKIEFEVYEHYEGIKKLLSFRFYDGYIVATIYPGRFLKVFHLNPIDKDELDNLYRWLSLISVSLEV